MASKRRFSSMLERLELSRLVLLSAFVLALSVLSSAQNPAYDETAPPPLRLISQGEKTRLAAENDVKKKTKLGLEMMDTRLKQAEASDSNDDHDQMFVELGAFHGLMDTMLEFLNKSDKDSGKVLNNFKRFEIGLRGFAPRLELIRRDLPLKYEQYVRILIRNLRNARAKAIEPLFDDSVVTPKKPN